MAQAAFGMLTQARIFVGMRRREVEHWADPADFPSSVLGPDADVWRSYASANFVLERVQQMNAVEDSFDHFVCMSQQRWRDRRAEFFVAVFRLSKSLYVDTWFERNVASPQIVHIWLAKVCSKARRKHRLRIIASLID